MLLGKIFCTIRNQKYHKNNGSLHSAFQVGQARCCWDDKAPEQPDSSLFKAGFNDLRAFFSLAGTKHCPSIVLQLCLRADRQYTGSCSTSHSFSFISLHFVMRISKFTFSFPLHITCCFYPWFNLNCFFPSFIKDTK